MICGGKMLLGAQGLAAEAGHILAVPDGPVCGCGQRGHLEAVASGTAIGRTARRRLKAGWAPESQIRELCDGDLGRVTSATVGQAALAGDTFAQELVAEAGTFIGRSLASLLHLFNPSIVICGGGVSMLGDVLLEPMRSALYRHALNEHYWRECRIVIAELGDDAGLIGAGALAMESGRGQGSGRE
jgi:glucokinase